MLQEFRDGSQEALGRGHISGRSPVSLNKVISGRIAVTLGFRFPLKIPITLKQGGRSIFPDVRDACLLTPGFWLLAPVLELLLCVYSGFLFSAKLRQAAQDPESKPALEGRYSDRDSMNKPIKENWTASDISGFGFAFTLVLLATILSAYSDQPAFWLLVGTGPLVSGLTLIAFLRHLFSVRRGLTAQGRNLRTAGFGWLNVLYRNGTNQ